MAGVCEFIDDNDIFFTPYITEIPLTEIGISIGLGAIGKLWLGMVTFVQSTISYTMSELFNEILIS